MEGLEESDEEDGGRKGKRKRGGDDLEDDFVDEEWGGLGAGLGEAADERDDAEDEDEESEGEEGPDDSDEEGDEESDGELGSDEEFDQDEGEHEDLAPTMKRSKGKGKEKAAPTKELPYTFPCPETHDEFLEIIEDIDDQDLPTVLQRIRALHHTSLAPENKFKLQVRALEGNATSMLTICDSGSRWGSH